MCFIYKNDKEKLKVFERGGVYLATKKIGKNNPKAEQIETDNKHRQRWNETVDVALVSGVPEQKILAVKKMEISDKVKENIQQKGHDPKQFSTLIIMAVSALQLIIRQVFDKYYGKGNMVGEAEIKTVLELKQIEVSEMPEQPKKSRLASKYPRLSETYNKLNQQNYSIQQREKQLEGVKKELANTKGIFKRKQRKELQERINELEPQIDNMKRYLSSIVQRDGYDTVKEFLAAYKVAKVEYGAYQSALAKWEQQTGKQAETDSIKAKLAAYQKRNIEQQKNKQHTKKKDRGAR